MASRPKLAVRLQRRYEVGRFDRGQGADVGEVAPAQQVARRADDACPVGMADRMAAGQRDLAHRAQDGVAFAPADLPHQRSGSRMLT